MSLHIYMTPNQKHIPLKKSFTKQKFEYGPLFKFSVIIVYVLYFLNMTACIASPLKASATGRIMFPLLLTCDAEIRINLRKVYITFALSNIRSLDVWFFTAFLNLHCLTLNISTMICHICDIHNQSFTCFSSFILDT